MLALAAGLSNLTQPDEQLAYFHGSCRLTEPGGAHVTAPCLSEDLPAPGYRNRWHYILGPESRVVLGGYVGQAPLYARVTVGAVADGTMYVDAGAFRLDIRPSDTDVARQLREAAPGAEECGQWLTVTEMPEGYLRLYIEEPAP